MKSGIGVLGLGLLLAGCSSEAPMEPSGAGGDGAGGENIAAGGKMSAAGSDVGGTPSEDAPLEPEDTDLEQLARNAYLTSRLDHYRSGTEIPALAAAVVLGDRIVARGVIGVRRWGEDEPAQLSDYFMLKSSTKPMTGYLAARIMQLEPKLPDSDAPFTFQTTILEVFPELASVIQPAYEDTTVAELMSHQSGMPYKPLTEPQDEYLSESSDLATRRFLYVKDAVQDPPEDPSPYGGGSIIVAAMLERLMGKTWEELMQAYVYDELGMINSGVGESPFPESAYGVASHTMTDGGPMPWTPPSGYEQEPHAPAGRNPHASISDFARFAAAQLPNVAGRGGKLSEDWLRASIEPIPDTDDTQGGWALGGAPWDGNVPRLWHNGTDYMDYSFMNVYPTEDFATVAMANYYDEQTVGSLSNELCALRQYLDMASGFDARAAAPKAATATDVYSLLDGFEGDKATDGSLWTRWATNDGVASASLTIELGEARSISYVRIAEHFERVRAFSISVPSADDAAQWEVLAEGTTIGPHRLVEFPKVEASSVRLTITKTEGGGANITEVWVD
jgi:CubicO group peptidase (beta-lactamase class C family)